MRPTKEQLRVAYHIRKCDNWWIKGGTSPSPDDYVRAAEQALRVELPPTERARLADAIWDDQGEKLATLSALSRFLTNEIQKETV